jgi:hypothetical protein
MRWRSRVGDVKEAKSVRGATRRLMYKELKVEEGLEGCPIFAAASDLPYKGCWRAGWLRAQPLDSATCMRLHIARPTCMSSLPWGPFDYCRALASSVRRFRVRENSREQSSVCVR